jgi:hypothetical protein
MKADTGNWFWQLETTEQNRTEQNRMNGIGMEIKMEIEG